MMTEKTPLLTNKPELIDLGYYFNVLGKAKWRILSFTILVTALVTFFVFNLTSMYRATATLLIEANQTKAVSFDEVYGLDSSRQEYYQTQFEILKSDIIAREVIMRLDLDKHKDFKIEPSLLQQGMLYVQNVLVPKPNEELTEAEQREKEMIKLIRLFKSRLSVSPILKTQLVKISYSSSSPKLSAKVANMVGEVYIQNNMQAKMGITRQTSDWLSDRLSGLRKHLEDSEARLQNYREAQELVDIEGVAGLIRQELEQTSGQLVEARNEANKLASINRIISGYGKHDLNRLGSIPEITSHPAVQNVKREVIAAERKVSELAGVYGAKHPNMIAARAELVTVQRNLDQQVRALVMGIEKDLSRAKRNVSALENNLTNIQKRYQSVTRKETEYNRLLREVETNRKIFNTFLTRSKETEVTSDFTSAVARFTDRAFAPSNPASPKKKMLVLLAFFLSLGFGVVMAFIFDALNDTVKQVNDVEGKLAQRMLGLLPISKSTRKNPFTTYAFFNKHFRRFSESVRTLRTGLVLSQMERENKVIEVTSSVPSEGKTTTATNLAFSMAQIEKVLLIDADMRRPSLGKWFDIPAYHLGLSNLIAQTASLEECLYHDEQSGLSILPCGQIPSNPQELLASSHFAEILEQLKQQFDRIVIDTPPTQAVSDSLIVAQHVDSVVYVVKANSTRQGVIKSGLSRLFDAKANVAGVVLNQVDVKKMGEHHGYYDSYEYSKPS